MEFVSYEMALKLKEKGFPQSKDGIVAMYNENGVFHALCATIGEEYWYGDFDDKDFACPTISQVLKWFREEKNIHIDISLCEYKYHYMCFNTKELSSDFYGFHNALVKNDKQIFCNTYEQAALAGIEYVLNNLI